MGREGKGDLWNCCSWDWGRGTKCCRNDCVLSLLCALLAFGSGTPSVAAATKVSLMWFKEQRTPAWGAVGRFGSIFVFCKFRGMTTAVLKKKKQKLVIFSLLIFLPFRRSFPGCLKVTLPSGSPRLWNICFWRTLERELFRKSFLKA